MRHGRAKAARKTLQFFQRTVGLKPPYSIVVDGNFIVHMIQQKIVPLRDRIDRVLQTTTTTNASIHTKDDRHDDDNNNNDDYDDDNNKKSNKNHPNHHHHNKDQSGSSGGHFQKRNRYLICQEAVDELKLIHQSLVSKSMIPKAAIFQQALDWVQKECRIISPVVVDDSTAVSKAADRSGSTKTPTNDDSPDASSSPQSAILHLLRDQMPSSSTTTTSSTGRDGLIPYIVATQDEDLLDELRKWGTVPLVRLANSSVLILEHPSKYGQRQVQTKEVQKWNHALPEAEKELVDLVKSQRKTRQLLSSSVTGGAGDIVPTSLLSSTENNHHRPQHHPPQQRGKGKAKGPNPLSCKRKRPSSSEGVDGGGGGGKGGGKNGTTGTSTGTSSSKRRRERAEKASKASQGETGSTIHCK